MWIFAVFQENDYDNVGMFINYNGKFNDTQKQLSLQGRKAMFSLKSKTNEMYLNTETMLSLFDTYVGSVLNYGCEIWGFQNGRDLEKVQLKYLKTLLGVKKEYEFCSCLL